MNELNAETLSVSCSNALTQHDLRYWQTDPIVYEIINAKLDKILRILDKKE